LENHKKYLKRKKALVLLGFLLAFPGCATMKMPEANKTTSMPTPTVTAPGAQVGAPFDQQLGDSSTTPQIGSSEVLPAQQIKPIVLVFGPGLARGFAYAGVLRELSEQKIPISAIVGTEMGGLIGALYAMSGSLNQFEWQLLKFSPDSFIETRSLLERWTNRQSEGKTFEHQLHSVFNGKDLTESKIPVRITALSKDTGIPMVLDRGNVAEVVRGTMAVPSLFTPGTFHTPDGEIQLVSASSVRPFPITEARDLNLGPVVVVNVLMGAESIKASNELKQADLVIRPNLKGIGYQDFKKKTEIAFKGKTAVSRQIEEIRKLSGIPQAALDKRSAYP
jgi:NTE family protein